MTLERQKYLEPFIVAQNQGKTVQWREKKPVAQSKIWKDVCGGETVIEDDYENIEYRIKPEPREFYVIELLDGFLTTYPSAEKAEKDLSKESIKKLIKVREVIE